MKALPISEMPDSRRQRRLVWAVRVAGAALMTALERDTSAQAVRLREAAAEDLALALGQMIMEQADPTDNKQFTPWLVREYADGRLILEDLGSANDTLTLFQRYARRLKPEQRDIQRYDNLAAAWQAVREFAEQDEAQSNRAQKALDRAQAYAESRILRQDPDGFTVAVPLTEFAAKWWGRGTRWCTAAERNNRFGDYYAKAPLLVALIPEVGKFQIWVNDHDYQFMDASDNSVSADTIAMHWAFFKKLFRCVVVSNGNGLRIIPEHLRDDAMCRIAVEQNGEALEYVPHHLRAEDICNIAVTQFSGAFFHVPTPLKSAALCRLSVMKNGKLLRHVPIERRTEELCSLAVQQTGQALEYVPDGLRSAELCQVAVAKDGAALHQVPRHLRTFSLCKIAVVQNGWALEYVPETLRSEELCEIAVARAGWVLRYVPARHVTAKLCQAAVAQNGLALQHVPDIFYSDELYRIAVSQNGLALEFVPDAMVTEDLCKLAVTQTHTALAYVPERLRSNEMRRLAGNPERWATSLAYYPRR